MKHHRVCTTPSCFHLMPCPLHSRPRNASWSRDRNRQAQHTFRKAVLARAKGKCERCGTPTPDAQLEAHHVRQGYTADVGLAVCKACHSDIDRSAR